MLRLIAVALLGLGCGVGIAPGAAGGAPPFLPSPAYAAVSAPPAPPDSEHPASAVHHWPTVRPRIERPFALGAQRWNRGHRGVDLAAPIDSPVFASGAGHVAYVGSIAGRPTIAIAHAGQPPQLGAAISGASWPPDASLRTTYEPVHSTLEVGMQVRRGQFLGTIAAPHPGCPTTWCLHWGAKLGTGKAEVYLNPLSLLGTITVSLRPH